MIFNQLAIYQRFMRLRDGGGRGLVGLTVLVAMTRYPKESAVDHARPVGIVYKFTREKTECRFNDETALLDYVGMPWRRYY